MFPIRGILVLYFCFYFYGMSRSCDCFHTLVFWICVMIFDILLYFVRYMYFCLPFWGLPISGSCRLEIFAGAQCLGHLQWGAYNNVFTMVIYVMYVIYFFWSQYVPVIFFTLYPRDLVEWYSAWMSIVFVFTCTGV